MSVRTLFQKFVDRGISRRQFVTGLAAAGMSVGAARALASEFSPFVSLPDAPDANKLPPWARVVSGTGGKLLVEQLKAADAKYLFITPSSGHAPILDALIDEPGIQLVQVLHEGALAAVADGYARASRTTPFLMMARPGLPNAMTQMFNAWKDHVGMVVMVDDVEVDSLGQDSFEDIDHMTSMTAPIVKWHWSVQSPPKIPEVLRRCFKFASTKPQGPVFFACPQDLFTAEATAGIVDQQRFEVSTELRPSAELTEQIASLLLRAENPLIYAGDDVRYCEGEPELLELAELTSIPVVNDLTVWSRPFPTDHPLYAGLYQPTGRYPGPVDVILHLGSRFQLGSGRLLRIQPQTKLVQIGLNATALGRTFPSEIAIVADVKLALRDLNAALKRVWSEDHAQRGAARLKRAREYQSERRALLKSIRDAAWNRAPLSAERFAAELDDFLPPNAAVVSEQDTYKMLLDVDLPYGPGRRELFTQAGYALGWALPAAFGVKLALPERPVVALVSDGSFLFSGPQPLWTFARYRAAVTIIVLNNRSYNGERNRIMTGRGRTYQTGRDLVCYLGDPDIQYVPLAAGFGVAGEVVEKPAELRPALERARTANRAGRPYLLDVHMERTGALASSSWHPELHVSDLPGSAT